MWTLTGVAKPARRRDLENRVDRAVEDEHVAIAPPGVDRAVGEEAVYSLLASAYGIDSHSPSADQCNKHMSPSRGS